MSRWGLLAVAYGVIGAVAVALGVWCGYDSLWTHPEPWLHLGSPAARESFSAILGLSVGGLVVVLTRSMVPRLGFATRLHMDLRPLAVTMTGPSIAGLAVMSALGEELLFRGLLQPFLGLAAQSLLFGLLHQIGGRSRWVWAAWAAMMGLAFGAMFQLTGSLAGPAAAHALINGLNLAFLKNHDPQPKRAELGGLLAPRSWVARPHP